MIIPVEGAHHHLQFEPEASDILVLESLRFLTRKLENGGASYNIGEPAPIFIGTLRENPSSRAVQVLLGIVAVAIVTILFFLLYV